MAGKSTGGRERTVAVRGLEPSAHIDSVELYFESKRSMGGPVEETTTDPSEGIIYVTFKDPKDAERVCHQVDHTLMGKKLKVRLQPKPEKMKDRLLLRNLPDVLDVEDLKLFLKKRTRKDAHTILLGDDESVALAIFNPSVDLIDMQSTLSGTPFHGNSLTAEFVPKPSTIVVRNYTPNGPDDEVIQLYFENKKRSGGDEVTEVKHYPDDGYYLVTFEDPEVAANVVKRPHVVRNQSLDVSLYHQCLGLSGGHTQRSFQIPAPLELSPDVGKVLSLFLQIPDMKDEVPSLLEKHHACMDTDQRTGKVLIRCNVTKDTKDCRRLLLTWREDIQEAITAHFDAFTVAEESITKEEFDEARPKLKQMARRCGGEAGFVFHDRETKISIVFHTQHQGERVDKMISAIHDTKQRRHRATNVETRTVEMSKQDIKMMQSCCIEQNVVKKYPQLQVTYDADNEAISIEGLPEEMDELEEAISRLKKKITKLNCTFDSSLVAQLFSSAEARAVLQEACLKKDPQGMVEFTSNSFNVWSLDATKAAEMKKSGRETIQKKKFKKSHDFQDAMGTREFDGLLSSIQERRQGTLVIKRLDQFTVVSLGVSPTFLQDMNEIEAFLTKENMRQLGKFDMEPQYFDLFCTFLENQRRDVREFALRYNSGSSELEATSNKTGLTELETLVNKFHQSLISQTRVFTEPSFMKYIKSLTGQRKVMEIKERKTCMLGEFVNEERRNPTHSTGTSIQKQQGHRSQTQQPKEREFADSAFKDRFTDQTGAGKRLAPKYPRIFLKDMNDITKVEHHFFVNSSNPQLDLSLGQVSNAFIGIGGPRMQKECKKKYPNGIKYGEIAVTGPGRTREDFKKDNLPFLDCKHILHCCLPETEDKEEIERVVRQAVSKSLAVSEGLCPQYKRKCIGIPALGTGNLGYPPELVAETMYNAVMDYGNENPGSTIEDVYFVLHKKDDSLAKVFLAENGKYRQAQKARVAGGEQDNQSYFSNQQPTAKGEEKHDFFQETRSKVTVTLKALSQVVIDDTVKELLTGYEESIVQSKPDVHRLNFWDPGHIEQVITSCRVAEVDLTLDFDHSRLTIRGHRDNVHVSLLHNIIKEAEDDINERETAHLVAWQIQWNWVEITNVEPVLKPYDQLNNYRIEKAYRDQRNTAIVYDSNRTPFMVNFEKMVEIPELTDLSATLEEDEAVAIIRQDKITEMSMDAPPPKNWSPMGGQLDVVPLHSESQEYKKVVNDFMATILDDFASVSGTNPWDLIEIVRVERVQNLMLYKQYMAFRKQMESKFSQGAMFERRPLWHGTKEQVADSIVKYGFNRSFCERSSYGEAVYFAKKAAYSSAEVYAERNDRDERIIFYCRVLVGEYLMGQQGMRFLPNRLTGGPKDYDSAVDDVQDPTIYVVFKDAQAYPEYKITFKDK